MTLTPGRSDRIRRFQTSYNELVDGVARITGASRQKILQKMVSRTSLINRYDRATGDALIGVTENLVKNKRKFTATELSRIIRAFVEQQILRPEYFELRSASRTRMNSAKSKRLIKTMLEMVQDCREGI